MALPFLDAMVPGAARRSRKAPRAERTRLVAHRDGARRGRQHRVRRQEEPVVAGGHRHATSTCRRAALAPLEPYRDYLTIVSNTDVRKAEAFTPPEIGGDHFRSSAVFLTQAHPKQTQGSDVYAGTSLDQLYAQRFGQDTPIPSMQLCIENVDQAGGCAYGYSCVYTDIDQLGVADRAAADDPRPARRRSTSCSASAPRPTSARSAAREDTEHPRLDHRRRSAA